MSGDKLNTKPYRGNIGNRFLYLVANANSLFLCSEGGMLYSGYTGGGTKTLCLIHPSTVRLLKFPSQIEEEVFDTSAIA